MEILTQQMNDYITGASWIRKMFEAGIELKQKCGVENVFDFSLGNPDVPPPPEIGRTLGNLAERADTPLLFGYVPNAGLPGVRSRLAAMISKEQKADLQAEHVVVTCGAAGALNVFFRSVLEQGDEVLCPAPFFVEYRYYAGNYGGDLKPVPSGPHDFELDLDGIDAAISPKTRAIIVNSPNNPTGRILDAREIEGLSGILQRHSEKNGRPIFLVSDEPYRFLTYDDVEVPPVLPAYEHSVVAGSFSKSLSLAGERVGYIAVNPGMAEAGELVNGLVLANRILGFVNAPVIGQYLLEQAVDNGVDVAVYDARRHAMAEVLGSAGIDFFMPQGAFYFFPEAPGGDDKAFVEMLRQQNILTVPGSGFGFPGHFRATFCMDRQVILNAEEGFRIAADRARQATGQAT